MRTTLKLDDDLVAAAKELAKLQGTSLGKVISELALQSLVVRRPVQVRNGVPVFPSQPSSKRPGLELVKELRNNQ